MTKVVGFALYCTCKTEDFVSVSDESVRYGRNCSIRLGEGQHLRVAWCFGHYDDTRRRRDELITFAEVSVRTANSFRTRL